MKSRKLERFGFLATIILAMAFIVYAMDVSAASANEYSISDAVKLQKFLTCQTTLTAKEAQALDIDQNKKLSAVDLTLLKRILIYGEPQQQETTTTLSETTTTETTTTTSETTTISSTSENETTMETTVTSEEEYPPKREKITDPDGNVIPEDTYNTLVEYAEKYNVKKYSIVWTNKEIIVDSLFVIGAEDEKDVKCKGAFWITSGEKFYQEHKDLFELDPTFTAQDYKSVRQWPYICWRQCDDAFVTEYPDNMLYFFTFNGEEADTKFFYGKYDGSNYGEWALVPKKTTISRRDVTNPDGAIIPEATFNTLVEFAQENGIEDYDIRWTGGEKINNSVVVLGEKSITLYLCDGAFQLTSGAEFYEMVKDLLDEEGDDEDFMEAIDIQNHEWIAWRHCSDEYLADNPQCELCKFYNADSDIRYFKWSQYEDDVYWALIPQ